MKWVDSDSSILFSHAISCCSVVVGPLLVMDIDPHLRRVLIDGCTQFSGLGLRMNGQWDVELCAI